VNPRKSDRADGFSSGCSGWGTGFTVRLRNISGTNSCYDDNIHFVLGDGQAHGCVLEGGIGVPVFAPKNRRLSKQPAVDPKHHLDL
jgi:hypothetical protein